MITYLNISCDELFDMRKLFWTSFDEVKPTNVRDAKLNIVRAKKSLETELDTLYDNVKMSSNGVFVNHLASIVFDIISNNYFIQRSHEHEYDTDNALFICRSRYTYEGVRNNDESIEASIDAYHALMSHVRRLMLTKNVMTQYMLTPNAQKSQSIDVKLSTQNDAYNKTRFTTKKWKLEFSVWLMTHCNPLRKFLNNCGVFDDVQTHTCYETHVTGDTRVHDERYLDECENRLMNLENTLFKFDSNGYAWGDLDTSNSAYEQIVNTCIDYVLFTIASHCDDDKFIVENDD